MKEKSWDRLTLSQKAATITGYLLFIIFIFAVGFLLLLLQGCKTTPDYTINDIYKNTDITTQESSIDSRKTIIYKDGKEQGYLQQSNIDPRKTVVYDKNGNSKGYLMQDPIDPRKTRYYKKK